MHRAFYFGLVLALMIGLSSIADAAVLCAPKDRNGNPIGTVNIRATCKTSEIQLDPLALGLVGPQGPAGPQGPVGPTGVTGSAGPQGPAGPGAVVKDANGAFIGVPNGRLVLLSVGNTVVTVGDVFPEGFSQHLQLWYEGANCSGRAFINYIGFIDASQLTPAGQILATTLYCAEAPPASLVTVNSSSIAPTEESNCPSSGIFMPPNTCCHNSPSRQYVAPAQTLM